MEGRGDKLCKSTENSGAGGGEVAVTFDCYRNGR